MVRSSGELSLLNADLPCNSQRSSEAPRGPGGPPGRSQPVPGLARGRRGDVWAPPFPQRGRTGGADGGRLAAFPEWPRRGCFSSPVRGSGLLPPAETFCEKIIMASVWVGPRGTVQDYSGFNASRDAEAIRKAIRGIGTDEKILIDILTGRPNAQRQLIAKEYRAAAGKELKDALKGDLSGNLERIMVALVTPPAVFDAKQLKKSMKGSGTDEQALIEILASRTSKQMKEVAQAYYTVYKKSLGDDISSDTSGDFRQALLTLADSRRDESQRVDEQVAKQDAQILYNAGEKKWGTDEGKFIEVLCFSSIPQLRLTFEEYRNLSGKKLEESIQTEMSGHFEDLLLAIVKCVTSTPAFFAERLHKSLKGAGTDEFTLNRILVSRSEIDLLDIRDEYKKMYGVSLYSAIKSDTSGDYGTTLLRICGGDD
ncbi:annexin A3 [Rhineura floridana]|uniref:annexin A3 n=1 Tax=Rhineura floridana TaxID=261503 RepID=UPI002AC82DBA|nr:annexin A3 [Rhineura floridana]